MTPVIYSPLVLKANATAPIIRAQLSANGSTPYPIPDGAVVDMFVQNDKMTAAFAHSYTCEIEDQANGIVTIDRSGEFNTLPGTYIVEFHVIGPASALRIFPDKGFAQIQILSDLP